jgi:hypothetical protein
MPEGRSHTGRHHPVRLFSGVSRGLLALGIAAALCLGVLAARADEGGVSFRLPGQFGSLAAAPPDPGWSLGIVDHHTSVNAGDGKSFAIGGQIRAGLEAGGDLVFLVPTYTFETSVLGGRPSIALIGAVGNMDLSADATLTGPRGRAFALNPSDSLFSGSDLRTS